MPHLPYMLQTRRLGLRPYVAGDIDALGPVFADPHAARFYPAMNTASALARWITGNLKNYDDHGFGLWAVELLETGRFIGDAGITWQSIGEDRFLEIGWHIHPDFRGLGYATEAGAACLRHGFMHLQAATLSSIVDAANAASLKVASRIHAGKRAYQGKNGPMLLFSTTASEFAAMP
jgi:RimJ/RimL family protein N-acetyltransferase